MKFGRLITIVAMLSAIVSGTILFATSQQVQRAEHKLIALHKAKVKEQDQIHVLHAEWDYLNRPDRLEALATQYLGMRAPDVPVVTASLSGVDAPIVVATAKGRHKETGVESAVYRQAASPQTAPVAPVPAPVSEGHDFSDLIHSLNGSSQ